MAKVKKTIALEDARWAFCVARCNGYCGMACDDYNYFKRILRKNAIDPAE